MTTIFAEEPVVCDSCIEACELDTVYKILPTLVYAEFVEVLSRIGHLIMDGLHGCQKSALIACHCNCTLEGNRRLN